MVNILAVIAVSFIVFAIGGGLGYFIYLRTRPMKQTWKANVYQVSEGARQAKLLGKKGGLASLTLHDLKPYSKDILEKVEKDAGVVIFRLQKLKKVTPAVEGDVVEYWGKEDKCVDVLLEGGQCTLLKKGYDKETGEKIFQPMRHSRVNLIKSEITLRKDRLSKEKDILQAITPWIVTGICIIGLVAISYIMISGFVEMSEHLDKATERVEKSEEKFLNTWKDVENLRQGVTPQQNPLGQQPKVEEPPIVINTSEIIQIPE